MQQSLFSYDCDYMISNLHINILLTSFQNWSEISRTCLNTHCQIHRRILLSLYFLGTGKTYTGTKLVYLFDKINLKMQEQGHERMQLVFCGPNNKSVDLVASKYDGLTQKGQIRLSPSETTVVATLTDKYMC